MIEPYYQDDLVKLYHGDARAILPHLPRFDLCLTDPPYGIGIAKKQAGLRASSKKKMLLGDWDKSRLDPQLIHLCIDSAQHTILWGGNYYADILRPSRCWLVWYKRPGMKSISFADAELAWTSFKACVRVKPFPWTGFITSGEKRWPHPTQKPVAVMRWCIEQVPGQVRSIVDPFAGSASSLLAARAMGIHSVGIDTDERYCDLAARRLAEPQ